MVDHFLKSHTYKGYYSVGETTDELMTCAHKKEIIANTPDDFIHKVKDCTYLRPLDQK
jgi:hypothetical protein